MSRQNLKLSPTVVIAAILVSAVAIVFLVGFIMRKVNPPPPGPFPPNVIIEWILLICVVAVLGVTTVATVGRSVLASNILASFLVLPAGGGLIVLILFMYRIVSGSISKNGPSPLQDALALFIGTAIAAFAAWSFFRWQVALEEFANKQPPPICVSGDADK